MKLRNLVSAVALAALAVPALAQSTLTLYTSQPNEDAQQTVSAFQELYPDIKVNWIRDGTTKLMARLQAEMAAGAQTPDVLLIADSVTMEDLKQNDLLQAYKSPQAEVYEEALYDPE